VATLNPEQARIKAAIQRASKAARDQHSTTDALFLARIEDLYRQAAADIEGLIRARGDSLGIIRLEQLTSLQRQIETRLRQLAIDRNQQLFEGMQQAAEEGTAALAVAIGAATRQQIAAETVRQITLFVEADGLQLSDRLWNIDTGTAEEVVRAINQAIIQGNSASEATADLLRRGEPVPVGLNGKERQAAAEAIAPQAAALLTNGEESARANVQRVMRTELNRAHGEAYMAAAFEHPDVVATRFLLSPRHPRPDICDMHASVNRYGLGPGVYPRDRNPWPAHPNTISFVEVVFADEISPADRAGKQTRIDWLHEQGGATQAAVLGGVRKRAAFLAGQVGERSIATKWKTLKKRLARQGVNVAEFEP
jgi:hypothetical protein